MYRQSPSRNQRSKSIKVKHVLQIVLLLAVCFWLIFQVKHSHDKKKEFDERNSKNSLTNPSADVNLKLGRKDIRPQEETFIRVGKHDGEEAEEEEETGGEEDAHGEEELDGDGKTADKGDEGREDGDDGIGDHDQENFDVDIDRQEDFIDDEKEREEDNETESEKDDEIKEGQTEDANSSEDQNYDAGIRNTHGAREEHYKADDASSAVTHATQSILNSQIEQGSLRNPNENEEKNIIEYDDKANKTVKTVVAQNTTELTWGDGKMGDNDTSTITITTVEKLQEILSSKSEEASPLIPTIATESKVEPELSNNLMGAQDFSLQNGRESITDSNQTQLATELHSTSGEAFILHTIVPPHGNDSEIASIASDGNRFYSNSSLGTENENTALTGGQTIQSTGSKQSAEREDSFESSRREESTDATENDPGDEQDEVNNIKDESTDEVEHDPIDTSDSLNVLEDDDHMDLDTLPEVQTELSTTEDAETE